MKVAPSILSADFANLQKEMERISKSEADYIHIDVMDGNFVPNLTIGPLVIKSLKKHSEIKFDVHLMIENPEKSYKDYINAGADILTFHIESCSDPLDLIKKIKSENCKVGISLKPTTSEETIFPYLSHIDLVLVMTVNPGFGGQEFIASVVPKISRIVSKIKSINKDIIISVDGGINLETAIIAAKNGATMLVSGSYLFQKKDFTKAVLDLKLISC